MAELRKKDSDRWKGDPLVCGLSAAPAACVEPWRSRPLMLSAVISGKQDSDLGRGRALLLPCWWWCRWWLEPFVLFFVNRLTSDSLSSLGLCADSVSSSLTAFSSD